MKKNFTKSNFEESVVTLDLLPLRRAKPKATKLEIFTKTKISKSVVTLDLFPHKKKKVPKGKSDPLLYLYSINEKSRRRTAYPQQIVTTRLLYCLQDRFAQLSRLQRI